MGQVPFEYSYLLIGNGQLARHLSRYLKQKNIAFHHWCRAHGTKSLETYLRNKPELVLLAISDESIVSFYEEFNGLSLESSWLHFSGALHHPDLLNFHPLRSFATKEDFDFESVGMISFQENLKWTDLFPFSKNQTHHIPLSDKKLYHAICASMANLPQWIWLECLDFMKDKQLPESLFKNFITQSMDQVFSEGLDGVSGPIKRQDVYSIQKNLNSLAKYSPNLKDVYELIQNQNTSLKEELKNEKHI